MRVVVLLILVGAAIGIVARVRYAAKQQREAVLARLASETAPVGPLSPTEELFRSEGVPMSDELRRGLVGGLTPTPPAPPVPPPFLPSAAAVAPASAAPSAVVAERPRDLTEMLAGLELPGGLVPLIDAASDGPHDVATFTASGTARDELPVALGAELVRLGWEVAWIDGATALARRGADSAIVRIYDRPADLTAPDGSQLHPGLAADRLVVTFTAG